MDYSAEAAGAVAERTLTSAHAFSGSTLNSIAQDLATGHWTKVVEELIDLRSGLPKLNRTSRRVVVDFMVLGYQPGRVNGRYPEPQALAAEIASRTEAGDAVTIAILRKELREVYATRALATGMSGRRTRGAVLTRVDRKLRGRACPRCKQPLRLGQRIFLDQDWNSAWHVAGGCKETSRTS